MLNLRFIAVLFLLCACAQAQFSNSSGDKPVKGKFYVSVDDNLRLYVNGSQVFECHIGQSESPEVDLKPGDRIVAQLFNGAAPRYFMLLFVSSDKQTMVSFPRTAVKILPDPQATDFAPADFGTKLKYSKEDKERKEKALPYKHKSDWIWGDAETCALAALLTRESFVPMPK